MYCIQKYITIYFAVSCRFLKCQQCYYVFKVIYNDENEFKNIFDKENKLNTSPLPTSTDEVKPFPKPKEVRTIYKDRNTIRI